MHTSARVGELKVPIQHYGQIYVFTAFIQRGNDRFKSIYQPVYIAVNCTNKLLFREILKNSITLKLTSNK